MFIQYSWIHLLQSFCANTKNIIQMFSERKMIAIAMSELEANNVSLDYPNKVFREATYRDDCYIDHIQPFQKQI